VILGPCDELHGLLPLPDVDEDEGDGVLWSRQLSASSVVMADGGGDYTFTRHLGRGKGG
jgi:hypothetical protein